MADFLGWDTRVACLALAGQSEAGLTPRWPRRWREAPLHCWRHGAPGPSCLTPSSRVSPPISSQRRVQKPPCGLPEQGCHLGVILPPWTSAEVWSRLCLGLLGWVTTWPGSAVSHPQCPGPAPSRKLPTPTLSVRGLPTVRGPSRMLKALPLRLSPPKRNTASVPSEECGRI